MGLGFDHDWIVGDFEKPSAGFFMTLALITTGSWDGL